MLSIGDEVFTMSESGHASWLVSNIEEENELVELYPHMDTKMLDINYILPKKPFRDVFKITAAGRIEPLDPSVPRSSFTYTAQDYSFRKKRKPDYVYSIYPSKKKTLDVDKQLCNEIFVKEATRLSEGKYLFLDAQDLRTTKYFLNHDVPLSRLACPQKDKGEFDVMAPAKHVTWELMGDHIRKYKAKAIAAAWLDYCCTWSGNGDVCPRDDVSYIVSHRLVRVNGWLFITVSRRGINKEEHDSDLADVQEVMGSGFSVEYRHRYRQMYFLGFQRKS
jgi:hypothetical protein